MKPAQPKLLIRSARQLLTLRGPRAGDGPRRGPAEMNELGLVEDGALLIEDGKIQAVGPTRRIENLAEARGAREINAAGRIVLPGLVDPLTHVMSGSGGFAGAEGDPFETTTREVNESSGPVLQIEAMKVLRSMARHGTTTIAVETGYGLAEPAEYKMLRVLSKCDRRPVEIYSVARAARTWPGRGREAECARWLAEEFLPVVRRRGLAAFASIETPGDRHEGAEGNNSYYTLAGAETFLRAAPRLGLRPRLETHRRGPAWSIPLAIEVEAVSVAALNWIAADEIAYLATAPGIVAILLPAEVWFDPRHKPPPARALIESGVPVAIATGYDHKYCPALNLQMAMACACREWKMTEAEAIVGATINAAHALRIGRKVGSLEVGKSADLVVLNVPDYRAIPRYIGANQVALTLKEGESVFRMAEVKPLEDL